MVAKRGSTWRAAVTWRKPPVWQRFLPSLETIYLAVVSYRCILARHLNSKLFSDSSVLCEETLFFFSCNHSLYSLVTQCGRTRALSRWAACERKTATKAQKEIKALFVESNKGKTERARFKHTTKKGYFLATCEACTQMKNVHSVHLQLPPAGSSWPWELELGSRCSLTSSWAPEPAEKRLLQGSRSPLGRHLVRVLLLPGWEHLAGGGQEEEGEEEEPSSRTSAWSPPCLRPRLTLSYCNEARCWSLSRSGMKLPAADILLVWSLLDWDRREPPHGGCRPGCQRPSPESRSPAEECCGTKCTFGKDTKCVWWEC